MITETIPTMHGDLPVKKRRDGWILAGGGKMGYRVYADQLVNQSGRRVMLHLPMTSRERPRISYRQGLKALDLIADEIPHLTPYTPRGLVRTYKQRERDLQLSTLGAMVRSDEFDRQMSE